MKIALINIYQNKVNRGAETYIRELSERFSKNHEVKVFTEIKPLYLMKFDIVIPTNGRWQVLIVRIITWLSVSKMIVSGQSGIGLDDRINLYTFPDVFIPLSKYAATWAKKINPLVKVTHIPNGVDLKRFVPNKNRPQNVVLGVGAFTKEKRHDLTIKAVSRLDNIKLIIAGGGGEVRAEIENLGLKLLGENRFELISVQSEKMTEIYKKATIFAYPTVAWESFGIAMVEAMASGLPVVANDDPIRREIVGDAGIFVNPMDTNAYARALKKAMVTNWGDKPRRQAEKFSWDDIAKKYDLLFKELIEK